MQQYISIVRQLPILKYKTVAGATALAVANHDEEDVELEGDEAEGVSISL